MYFYIVYKKEKDSNQPTQPSNRHVGVLERKKEERVGHNTSIKFGFQCI